MCCRPDLDLPCLSGHNNLIRDLPVIEQSFGDQYPAAIIKRDFSRSRVKHPQKTGVLLVIRVSPGPDQPVLPVPLFHRIKDQTAFKDITLQHKPGSQRLCQLLFKGSRKGKPSLRINLNCIRNNFV